jgi:hypothetical protein
VIRPSSDDDVTFISAPSAADRHSGDGPLLKPGQAFGAYTIHRLLGRGGMGEVYEAEHREHGHRVAMKVLTRRLAGPEDRARFLREGQLAASLNHPNSVYVYGSEQIDGTPVITMELVAGGTLKDVIDRDGPMPPAAAVDAVLQLIAGLEAAHARGILHRDVKPSNCFVEPDGTMKVGDFGLSIPAEAPEVTQAGAPRSFEGTPQYAAPEQLRGESLDARADIYAVGATLYCLLTGRPPFDDADLMTLVTRIATVVPERPRVPGGRLPGGLSDIVLRCLAKDKAGRPPTYAALAADLRPFSSAVPEPASLRLRLAAGVIDWAVLFLMAAPLTIAPTLTLSGKEAVTFGVERHGVGSAEASIWILVAVCVLTVLYYVLFEHIDRRSIGKRICGLEVTTANGEPPGLSRIVLRTLLFTMPTWLLLVSPVASLIAGPGSALAPGNWGVRLLNWSNLALSVLLFSSIRRRNGFAGWHELASGTRVVARPRRAARAPAASRPWPLPAAGATRIGPFDVVGPLGGLPAGELQLGFDGALKRHVWLLTRPAGTPAISAERCQVKRPGRLRWLTGRRTAAEAWDAFEAPDGAPLLGAAATPQPWRLAKHWLLDLARELDEAVRDGTLPILALDRVWVTGTGHARLLDVPAPGVTAGEAAADRAGIASCQQFLSAVAWRVLGEPSPARGAGTLAHGPLPRSAHATLGSLGRDGFVSMSAVVERLGQLADREDEVTRGRRASSLALAGAPVLFTLIALTAILPVSWRLLDPESRAMTRSLIRLRAIDGELGGNAAAERRALETYLAYRHRSALAADATWKDPATVGLLGPLRPFADAALANHPAVTPAEYAGAEAAVRPLLQKDGITRRQMFNIAALLPAVILLVSAVAALSAALVFRRGVWLRLLGLSIATGRGAEVSRLRAFWRASLAWSPVLALWAWLGIARLAGRPIEQSLSHAPWVYAAAGAALVAGAAWTIVHPARGPHDRVAGTWLVPR